MNPPHLLTLDGLGAPLLEQLLTRAAELHDQGTNGGALPQPLKGHTVANLFFEPSTRTRASFELAAVRLGAHVVNLDMARSSTVKGESLADTIRTLHAMEVGLFVVRHSAEGIIATTVDELHGQRLAIVSAGEGRADHPTQGLIDALVLRRRLGSLVGKEIAIVGDIAHSRVARSAFQVLSALGATVRIAGPTALMPQGSSFAGAIRCDSLDTAMSGVDVVMALRVQRERITHGGAPDEAAYHQEWGITETRIAARSTDALVMHPGPFNREVEITSEVADGPRSLILEQVAFGIPVRMAVLEWLAGSLDG